MTALSNAIALNRFGLGVHLDDAPLSLSPQTWLLSQLNRYEPAPVMLTNQRSSQTIMREISQKIPQMRQADDVSKKALRRALAKQAKDDYLDAVQLRANYALNTPTPFIERLVHFWSNHFAISVQKPAVTDLAGAFEMDAIRPYILGNFKDMLLAVEQHPAMLLYLDQAQSIGPNSQFVNKGKKNKPNNKRGLNENLAREILELHTLGVRSGYTQADVTEFAKALTGWSVLGDYGMNLPFMEGKHGFAYRPLIHEPGERLLLGKRYSQMGEAQGTAILHDLANATATAQHIATKLARHFVSDQPPQSLIDKLSQRFTATNGNLSEVYRVLIEAPETWQDSNAKPNIAKFKTPWDWLISSLRGLGMRNVDHLNITQILNHLGQPMWKPGSPAGYDDVAESWAAPNALLRRVEMAQRLVAPLGDKLDARSLTEKLLLGTASAETVTQVSRAESASTSLALLLVSPEFLRR